jgi:hypothetical protein
VPKPHLAAALTLALVATPAVAAAEAHGMLRDTVYLPVGASVAAGIHPSGTSGVAVGGEVSFVRLDDRLAWYGAWVDGVHDFGSRSTRVGVGPEVGFGPLGLDAGYLASIDDAGAVRHGFSLRTLFTIGVVGLYGRWGHLFGAGPHDHGEVGLLAKFPIELWHPRHDTPGRRVPTATPPPDPLPARPASPPPPPSPEPEPEPGPAPREFATPP